MVIAEVEDWEKRSTMIRKKELQRDIIIEDDLTRKEREIQRNLREMVGK